MSPDSLIPPKIGGRRVGREVQEASCRESEGVPQFFLPVPQEGGRGVEIETEADKETE